MKQFLKWDQLVLIECVSNAFRRFTLALQDETVLIANGLNWVDDSEG